MGDRYIWYVPCPECEKEVEYYDAPSCLMYVAVCDCGWREPKNYYEIGEHEIVLCTRKEYEEKYINTPFCLE